MKFHITVVALLAVWFTASNVGRVPILAADMKQGPLFATHLRCDGLRDPLGIELSPPRFSWWMQSDKQNAMQSAYQIIVDGKWDSGKVASDRSINVEYAGPPLTAGTACRWSVRIWDNDGNASEYSPPATFSTGITEWSAKWIGFDPPEPFGLKGARWIWYPEGNPARSAPIARRFFRRTMTLPADAKIASATLSITADNAYSVSINGQAVGTGNDFTMPGKFGVKALLHGGDNLIEVTADNIGDSPNPAGMIAKLHVDTGADSPADLITDANWEASTDRKTWTVAKSLGRFGMDPWGELGPGGRPLPARYLRREFTITKPVSRATAYICGMGFFDFSVNGQSASDHLMDPALSDFSKADYYVTFDVTDKLRQGANAIGVVLGNGRFFSPRVGRDMGAQDFGYPKLLMQMELEFADGSKQTVISDESWRITTQGPIRENNEYDGEFYDARMEMPGWDTPGFDDHAWTTPQVVAAPSSTIVPQMIEPMRVTKVLHPVSVANPAPGIYVVDMGESFYGNLRVKASGRAGTVMRMTGGYSLNPDGSVKTADNRSALGTDTYVFKGDGFETWSPRFRGQGERRIQITGFPGTPSVDNFDGLVIHTDAEPVGEFSCSNDLINRIHAATVRGTRMFLRSAPLDPDRDERQAWMGDPSKDSESEAYNFDVSNFYAKWMDDLQRCQRKNGSIPDIAMYWATGDGIEWPSVVTIIPDWMAGFYGDSRVAENHYDVMKTWVLSMNRHLRPDGTIKGTNYGDWCDTYTIGGHITDFGATPDDVVSTAYHFNNCRIMQRLAKSFGRADDEKLFGDMADHLKTAFNRRFLETGSHTYLGDTQCDYVLALAFGLVPDDQHDAIVAKLVNDIMVKHQGHLSVGLIGMQWLMQVLSDAGRPDVAWTIATQTTRPSWGYMLSKGSTTIWERWDYDTRGPGMNSESLLIQAGNLDAWFYQTLAGIRPAGPGFKQILIAPKVLGDLTWARAHFDCPYGRIESGWKIADGKFTLDVTIPANTTATIIVPGKNGGTHQVGSGPWQFKSDL